ncbi:hypothetical protein RJ640_025527 [Escallonia rubra]|uniref:Uncharacterized protein n=1 Tax=Escallonia rubra TaxID=112253 RepID=A0AA88RQ52_9ASTE|nr:hypothetical protein RJ640_025527 [Escallonia rubra]
MGMGLTTIFSSGISFSHLNLLTRWCMNTSISSRAYSFPGHILGPPPKGTNVYGAGPLPSNLDGSNFKGSGKNSSFLCVEFALQYICENLTFQPFGIEKPLYMKSERASLKAPCSGGASLSTSHATFHEYFIFCTSSQFKSSPGAFDLAISICSEKKKKKNQQ